jgi:hypothetical protein
MYPFTQELTAFIAITTGIVFLLGVLIITLISLYQKKQNLFKANIATLKNDFEKNLLQVQIEIQEQTFKNISCEIHDHVSHSLTLAKLNLNTINWKDALKAESSVKDSIQVISSAISELSDISKSLNSDLISNLGLIRVIEIEVVRLRNMAHLNIDFDILGEPFYMNADKELVIYRIIQEAFNNVLKHAKATKAYLTLDYQRNQVQITVKDNGVGFNTNQAILKRETNAGLANIETRARLFNGELKIHSTPSIGTQLLVSIPHINIAS